jgi:hypothetical protein
MTHSPSWHIWTGNRSPIRAVFEADLLIELLLFIGVAPSKEDIVIDSSPRPSAAAEGNIFSEDFDLTVTLTENPKFRHVDKIVLPGVVDYGVLGCRVALTTEQSINAIQTSDQSFMQRRWVLPEQWADYPIYRSNGFNLTTTPSLEHALACIAENRADVLPLGINEVTALLETHAKRHPNLILEPGHLLYYPMPLQIYCHPRQQALAKQLELGFKAFEQQGLLWSLFSQHYAAAIAACHLSSRKLHLLKNPMIGNQSPLSNFTSPLLGQIVGD